MEIHFINKLQPGSTYQREGLTQAQSPDEVASGVWTSEAWVLDPQAAGQLVGGMIYLHDTQASNSFFGGRILDVTPLDGGPGRQRYRISFIPDTAAKNAIWPPQHRGPRRWTSGPVAPAEAVAA